MPRSSRRRFMDSFGLAGGWSYRPAVTADRHSFITGVHQSSGFSCSSLMMRFDGLSFSSPRSITFVRATCSAVKALAPSMRKSRFRRRSSLHGEDTVMAPSMNFVLVMSSVSMCSTFSLGFNFVCFVGALTAAVVER